METKLTTNSVPEQNLNDSELKAPITRSESFCGKLSGRNLNVAIKVCSDAVKPEAKIRKDLTSPPDTPKTIINCELAKVNTLAIKIDHVLTEDLIDS